MTVYQRNDFTAANLTLVSAINPPTTGLLMAGTEDGSMTVFGNRAFNNRASSSQIASNVTSDTLPNDYSLTALVRCVDPTAACYMELRGRRPNNSNFYAYRFAHDGMLLFKKIADSYTVLASNSTVPVLNQDYAVELRIVGTSLKVFVDTVQVLTATDGDLTSGNTAGIAASQGATGGSSTLGFHLDYFQVADPPAGGGVRIRPYFLL